jgi:CRP-like cAMP-binding protein
MGPAKVFQRIVFPPGTVIFSQGEPAQRAYIVQSGRVELSRTVDGERQVVDTLGENGLFGELALIGETSRLVTATAIDLTTCIVVQEGEFQSKLDRSDPFVRGVLRVLTRKIGEVYRRAYLNR